MGVRMVIFPLEQIAAAHRCRVWRFAILGKSRRGSSLGKRSLMSSALLMGMCITALAKRANSMSGCPWIINVIHILKPAGVNAGVFGTSSVFSWTRWCEQRRSLYIFEIAEFDRVPKIATQVSLDF